MLEFFTEIEMESCVLSSGYEKIVPKIDIYCSHSDKLLETYTSPLYINAGDTLDIDSSEYDIKFKSKIEKYKLINVFGKLLKNKLIELFKK